MTGGGPRLVREAPPDLAVALGTLWLAVTRAGGGVGYAADIPEAVVRAAAEATVAEIRAGRQQLISLDAGAGELAGTVFLRRGDRATIEHRGEVLKLMVRPDLQRRGLGTALLDALVAHARSLGLEQLLLSVRGSSFLPGFYTARGWVEVGRWRDALRIGPDDVQDEVWFQLRVR